MNYDVEALCQSAPAAAVLSDDRRHRLVLTRRWAAGPIMVTCGYNPSTADAMVNDPTIRKDMGFAQRLGCSAIVKVNLHTVRATEPKDLRAVAPPHRTCLEGHLWMAAAIKFCARYDEPFWMTWGANARNDPRVDELLVLLTQAGVRVRALERLSDGTPAHTLMLPYSAVDKL